MDSQSITPHTGRNYTASMWADVNALKKEISLPEKERSEQRVESLLNEIEGCTDEELERFERICTERRGRTAAHAIVAPIDTAQPSNPRSRCSEISCAVHDCMKGNTESRMDPKPGELEPSSAGTGFETPGQQCLSNWEMKRTTVDGCFLVDGTLD